MKQKIIKGALVVVFCVLVIVAIINTYNWVVSGEQQVKINTTSKAYTNSDLYLSIVAQKNGEELETKSDVKLLDSKGKRVKGIETSYEGNNAIISIPDIKSGNYIIEAKVSSEKGKDTVQKEIYITDGNTENITINFDKGIYKPGDNVNFRALLTTKKNDEPLKKDVNVSIYDGNDNKVYNENIKTSDFGILSGTFTLANEVNSGIYKLVVKTDLTETTKQFKVNPYIMPKYEIKIGFDKENYLVGDTATINVNGKYFFGEPVSNAKYVIYIDGKKHEEVISDQQGNATINYEIKQAKTYSIKVEAEDTSNYFIEESSDFVAGTDLFEIQLLPEYETLVAGTKNDVYVFTKNADGTPIKTYVTVKAGNYTKQVATDDNGIGKFSMDINSMSFNNKNENNNIKFEVVAQNMSGEKVRKNIDLTVQNKNVVVATNKVKYNQGEDIEIKISSDLENTKNIYFFKNEKLIKMLSTESTETRVNLGEEYGLIDIYITTSKGTSNTYKNQYSHKRTVFIKPTKELNIDIITDKEEYKPGDDISITFSTTDENDNSIEAALLVSMLDNAILSLADNDLSIDNIKMALSDLKLSNELDAATLYSCIINDKSEQAIMGLLLKQKSKDINVSETILYTYKQESESAQIAIISLVFVIIMTLSYFIYLFEGFRNFIKHALNYIIFNYVFLMIMGTIFVEFLDVYLGNLELIAVIATSIISLAVYILWVSKLHKYIFKTSVSIISLIVLAIIFAILIDAFEIEPAIILLAIAILALILTIKVKLRPDNKTSKKIIEKVIYVCKFIGAVILSAILTTILANILEKTLDRYYIFDEILSSISIIGIYTFNYLFNKKEKVEEVNQDNDKKDIKEIIIIILALIGGVVLISSFIGIFDTSSEQMGSGSIVPETSVGLKPSDLTGNAFDGATNSSGITSGLNFSDLLEKGDSYSESSNTGTKVELDTVEKTTDDNIRNIFLESMCFIPELVADNGNAELKMKLSDNITTWTIQTVGNTKDGKIGYGILDTVKVFKEFFVDFELPKNIVESDIISVPVTVYNYTNTTINTIIKVEEQEWFTLQDKTPINLTIEAESSKMVYVPITVLKSGENKFRVEASDNSVSDIVEKQVIVYPKGHKVEKVVSTGTLDKDIQEDLLILENIIENTATAKVKIYASTMSQNIEGMENIFRMPTGCFEQVSSSLYPNILALKYLEQNGIVNEQLKAKAMNYISSGYQKLLTYEVQSESGGYSLYGKKPAETVLTAYGLMQLTDLKEVYNVDEKVLEDMTNFLYQKQNMNGSFTITGYNVGGAGSRENLALNAYVTWALSESNPNNSKLTKSVEYLKDKLDNVNDNYTLALIANILANVGDKQVDDVVKRLVNNINIDGNSAYITSNIKDYYGSRSNSQTIQTVALTSMALSKTSKNANTNKSLINYLISKKDVRGTWYSTQATILSLKALNEQNEKNKLDNQTIKVKVNSEEQTIEIKENPLEYYELTFKNLSKENKLNIDIENGNAYYEVVEEYYIPYENVDKSNDEIEVAVETNNNLKVNEILDAKVKLINRSDNDIYNGMVTISIPQGFVIDEQSLMILKIKGIIEKYETSYTELNLYLRNFTIQQIIDLDIKFRASYPVDVTGMAVRAYDYYNPEIEGKSMPINIRVSN